MHPAEIPDHIRERITTRRGRRHQFETIDPARTALLVLDMQNVFVEPDIGPTFIDGLEDIVPNINRLVGLCRAAGIPVIWTQHTASEEWRAWCNTLALPEKRREIIETMAEGSYGFQLFGGLQVEPMDLQIIKRRHSAFAGESPLHASLQEAGRDALIVTGTMTNVCCETTTRDALQLNYNSIFVGDATGTRTDEEHMASLINLALYFSDVMTTDEVAALLARG